MVELVKKVLKSSSLGRALYDPLHRLWRCYSIPHRRALLKKNGYKLFSEVHALMTDHGIPYYCEAGTLLGFIRDKGFIANDDDIDLAVLPGEFNLSKVLKVFIDNGFSYLWGHEYGGRFIEFTVKNRYGISIDVFQHQPNREDNRYFDQVFLRYYPDRTYPSDKCNTALLFKYLAPTGIKTISEHGIEVNVPENAEEVLDSEFGPWRIPDPNFKSESTGYKELPGFTNRLTLEEALGHQ